MPDSTSRPNDRALHVAMVNTSLSGSSPTSLADGTNRAKSVKNVPVRQPTSSTLVGASSTTYALIMER
jgi:hypothetical protein